MFLISKEEMDVFQTELGTYYNILCITGLWPFNDSPFAKIQRTIFGIIMISCFLIQFWTLAISEFTLKNLLLTLSYGCPQMLYFLRYVGFIFSFSTFFLAVVEMSDLHEILLCTIVVFVHIVIMFLNNHSGQYIIDDGNDIFHETYNSVWYCVPVNMQKLILMILRRTSLGCEFNLSGLFVPCYEGFSLMMSSSFSYFTMLYSMQ
ncbi:uncharacterized protein LOC122404016 [Colletes gigas]|uniref:uncharacterized protein LOC122404016 n=1 Tax=Colletes gigas TaxID=935657 RepID=UPI001C9B56E8|nr:uncharacterized protein LOC122404016 [Colletes gigas]